MDEKKEKKTEAAKTRRKTGKDWNKAAKAFFERCKKAILSYDPECEFDTSACSFRGLGYKNCRLSVTMKDQSWNLKFFDPRRYLWFVILEKKKKKKTMIYVKVSNKTALKTIFKEAEKHDVICGFNYMSRSAKVAVKGETLENLLVEADLMER